VRSLNCDAARDAVPWDSFEQAMDIGREAGWPDDEIRPVLAVPEEIFRQMLALPDVRVFKVNGVRIRLIVQPALIAGTAGDHEYLEYFHADLVERFAPPPSTPEPIAVESRPKRGRRGPKSGTVGYGDRRRALFPDLKRLIDERHLSPNAAALELAENGRVPGRGTNEARARQLASLYIQERDKIP
jgi:hypothetical protein